MRSVPPASSLLNADQLASVRARSNLWGCYLVAHAWGVIIASIALFALHPNVFTYVLAVLLIGSRQLGLLILMHDGAHGLLAKDPGLNRRLSQWLCAYPMLADTDIYRRYHLQHHARTQQDDDPDIVLTGAYPIPRASLQRKLLRDLTGRTGFGQRRMQLTSALGDPALPWPRRCGHLIEKLGPQLAANLLLFTLFAFAGYWYLYFLLWLLPMLTWQQLVLRVRNIAEHAVVPDRDDPFRNARTTLANPLERLLVAPYWVNYHLEHHLAMWVPCYRLSLFRRYLFENGFGPRMVTAHGYLAVLRHVTDLSRGPGVPRPPGARAMGTFGEGFRAPG